MTRQINDIKNIFSSAHCILAFSCDTWLMRKIGFANSAENRKMDILSKYPTPNAAGQEFVKQMCEMHGGRCSIALARELPIVAEFRQEFGPIGMQLLSMACMPFVRKSGNEIEVLPVQ